MELAGSFETRSELCHVCFHIIFAQTAVDMAQVQSLFLLWACGSPHNSNEFKKAAR